MRVKFLQHVYTSAPEGLGDPGFQTVAASKGISEREILLLEKLSQYRPPDASREESPKSFPPSYSLINFSQRYMCVSRVFYTGRDFRGQPNNYLAHNLLIRLKDFARLNHNAFALFGTSGLFADVPPKPNKELPALEADVQAGDNFAVLEAIPRAMPHEVFVALLNAAIHSFQRNRKIVLVPPSLREGYELVQSLMLCIPRRYRFWFTFSTYQRDPYAKAMWCQLVPRDGDFGFSDDEYHNLWVFNFPENRFSEVHERLPYVDMLANYLYQNDVESVRRVVELADVFEQLSVLDVTARTVTFLSQEYQLLQTGIAHGLPDLIKLIESQGTAHAQHRLLALRLPAYLLAALQSGDTMSVPWLAAQAVASVTRTEDPNAQISFEYAMRSAVPSLLQQGDVTDVTHILERMVTLPVEVRTSFLKAIVEPFFAAAERMLSLHTAAPPDAALIQGHARLVSALLGLYTPDMPPSLRPDAWLLEFLFLYRHFGWLPVAWPAFKSLTTAVLQKVADPARRQESVEALRACLSGARMEDEARLLSPV